MIRANNNFNFEIFFKDASEWKEKRIKKFIKTKDSILIESQTIKNSEFRNIPYTLFEDHQHKVVFSYSNDPKLINEVNFLKALLMILRLWKTIAKNSLSKIQTNNIHKDLLENKNIGIRLSNKFDYRKLGEILAEVAELKCEDDKGVINLYGINSKGKYNILKITPVSSDGEIIIDCARIPANKKIIAPRAHSHEQDFMGIHAAIKFYGIKNFNVNQPKLDKARTVSFRNHEVHLECIPRDAIIAWRPNAKTDWQKNIKPPLVHEISTQKEFPVSLELIDKLENPTIPLEISKSKKRKERPVDEKILNSSDRRDVRQYDSSYSGVLFHETKSYCKKEKAMDSYNDLKPFRREYRKKQPAVNTERFDERDRFFYPKPRQMMRGKKFRHIRTDRYSTNYTYNPY